ncbi:MAG: hypothetical protein QNJ84_16525 [Alphaproteobacteria bacterium]|nr:hypothetical protein [Alphaproteobacteria bacterium]
MDRDPAESALEANGFFANGLSLSRVSEIEFYVGEAMMAVTLADYLLRHRDQTGAFDWWRRKEPF